MKHIFFIICAIVVFSIPSFSFAANQNIEDLLDIKYGPEVYEIEMVEFPEMSFADENVQTTYDTYVKNTDDLRSAIISKYSQGGFSYSQMNGIVSSYSSFVYYTNAMFRLVKEREYDEDNKEIALTIKRYYGKSRTFYNRLRFLVLKKD